MRYWEVEYFPPAYHSGSPEDYILSLARSDPEEAAEIEHIIDWASTIKLPVDWLPGWRRHKVRGKVWQIDAGKQHRVMFCLEEGKIVVLHICKKVSQKTRQKDIDTATRNHSDYKKSN